MDNAPKPQEPISSADIDRQWLEVARARQLEIERNEAVLVPGDLVFAKLKDRLQK